MNKDIDCALFCSVSSTYTVKTDDNVDTAFHGLKIFFFVSTVIYNIADYLILFVLGEKCPLKKYIFVSQNGTQMIVRK